MSQSTQTTTTTSTPTCLEQVPLYREATEGERALLRVDMARCLADGLPESEYLASLAAWEGSPYQYLADCGLPEEYAAELAECQAEVAADVARAGESDDTDEPDDTQDSEPADEDAPAPSSSLAEANKTRAVWNQECRGQADANFRLQAVAYQYVEQYLGSAPGKATRATAVENLAADWHQWDEESVGVPRERAMKRLKDRVNTLLAVHAVTTLLGDGSGIKQGKSKTKRLAWGTLREMRPLVFRVGGEGEQHTERWAVLASVAEPARALVAEVAVSGMKRQDVVLAVAKLLLVDANQEHTAAKKAYLDDASGENKARLTAAEEAVEKWGGKVERTQAPKPAPTTPSNPPAATGKTDTPSSNPTSSPAPAAKPSESTPTPSNPPAADPVADAESDTDEDDDTDDSEDGDSEPTGKPQRSPEARQGENLLRSVVAATPKTAAGMMADAIGAHEEPDTVFWHLMLELKNHPELCPEYRKAVDKLLLGLNKAGHSAPAAA